MQAEEARQQLAERLALATKGGQVGIWDWDVVNDILIWNDNMYRQYGITRDQFPGAYEAWTMGLHPDDPERGDEEVQKALRGEKDLDTGFHVLWPEGSTHHIRAMALVRRNAAGEPLRMIGTNWDITNEERLENELRESGAYARSLIEVNLDPLVTISASGTITDVNEATVLATGIPREQLVGEDFSNCFSEPDKAREGYQKAFADGTVRDFPLTLRHISGRTTDVLYNSSVYRDPQGKVLGVFAAARDITERKPTEAIVLKNLARAEELARLKSRFVSMASHELRTPLANIMLECDLLKNFLENALKYSPDDTKVEMGAEAGPDSLTLSVRDRGIGVPEAERQFLFDAFSRASNVGDRPGSGLGLFIAQKCAQAHGGQLRYEPLPKGSVFSVTIPLATIGPLI